MPVLQQGVRNFFTLFLAEHPGNLVWGLGPWTDSTQVAFLSFDSAGYAHAQFRSPEGRSPQLSWNRVVLSIRPDESHPIIVLRDSFEGADAAIGKVASLNLMAEGEVETPAGNTTPEQRTFDAQGTRAPGLIPQSPV